MLETNAGRICKLAADEYQAFLMFPKFRLSPPIIAPGSRPASQASAGLSVVPRPERVGPKKGLMYDIPAGVISVVLLAVALAAIEIGFRIGCQSKGAAVDDDSKTHINATQSSTLGILALLLAFTFSLSLQHLDARSNAVVDEANTIGTAYLRAQLLPAPLRDETRTLLREYVDLRVRAGGVSITNDDEWASLTAEAGALQSDLWNAARRAADANPSPVPSGMFVQATNDLIDSFGRRDAAIHRRVPEVVLILLLGTFLITSGIVGFSGGVTGRRPPLVSFAMVVLIVMLVFVILDVDRPIRGLITVSEKNLRDLQASMKADPAARARPAIAASGPAPGRAASR